MSAALPVNHQSFAAEVLQASAEVPVLVDFWAPWCGPCRSLAPVLDTIAAEFDGRLRVRKLNTDDEPELAAQYSIRGIPAVKLFRDGRVVDEFVGAQPLGAVRQFVARHLGPAQDDPLDAAAQLLDSGRTDEAEAALDALAPAAQAEPRVRSARARLYFMRLAASPDETDLIQSARVRAARHFLGRDPAAGFRELFDAMARNRRFASGQGREDAVHAFELGSVDDAIIADARRRLASLLH